jgi:hypothetical protein
MSEQRAQLRVGHAGFVSALFLPTDLVELRVILDRRIERRWARAVSLPSFEMPESWARMNVYFGVNPRRGQGSTAKDVAVALCLFVDIDEKVSADEAKVRIESAGLPEPTALVASGGGVHAYWRLVEPMTDLADWSMRQKALIRAVGADPAVHDAPRIMRLPGTLNWKYDPPAQCELIECHGDRRYELGAFPEAASLPAVCSSPSEKRPHAGEDDLERRAVAYLDAMPPAISGQGGHNATYAAASALVHGFGLDPTAAFGLLWNNYNPRCQPPWSERELRHKVDNAGSKPHDRPYGWLRNSEPAVSNNGAAVDLSGMTGRCATTIAPAIASRKLRLRCLADVEPTRIDWLWYGRIALGKLTVIAGHAGLGKSFLTCDIAARVSAGLPWPDEVGACPQGHVLVLNAEDDPGDTIRPRLDAAGADVWRIHFIDGVDGLTAGEIDPFDLARDSRILREHIEQTPGVKLVTIDPVTAYVGQVDDHRNSEVRGLLRPLAELARDTGVAIVIVTHLNKGAGEAINRVIGSIAWGAAARAVWAVIRDPADADRRLFLNIKNNLGLETLGLAYKIAPPSDGEGLQAHVGTPRIEWEDEPLKIRADDIMVGQPDAEPATTPAPPARGEAESFLREVLKDGPTPTKTVQAEARAAGIKWATVRRAKDALQVRARKTAFSGESAWSWCLPDWTPPDDVPEDEGAASESPSADVSTFDWDEHLRPDDDEGDRPPADEPAGPDEGAEDAQDRDPVAD